ncbi:hypothetical protein FPSE5266_20235 [Fusarium pseudograminearum]|nr:hypothetical protein FPSE5266_20235 [Fusarium pseudograminearum]
MEHQWVQQRPAEARQFGSWTRAYLVAEVAEWGGEQSIYLPGRAEVLRTSASMYSRAQPAYQPSPAQVRSAPPRSPQRETNKSTPTTQLRSTRPRLLHLANFISSPSSIYYGTGAFLSRASDP